MDLEALRPRQEEALARLTAERRERALRLRQPEPRLRSMGAGLLLRHFLGDRPLSYDPGGKPFIPGAAAFSLSHSGSLAVLAFASCPVGVDVEIPRPVGEALARRVLTEGERAWLEEGTDERFFFLWTRKEAALKCLGTGLDRSLASFSVLPWERPELDGKVLALHTVTWGGAALSAATEREDAAFVPRALDIDELLA